MFDVASLVRRPLRACAPVVIAAVFAALPAAVLADTLQLKQGHPERYTVVKGDTLWDISGRFLNEPWRWPEIWEDNTQIENPHLIYPGDELVLTYREGRPVLRHVRSGVVKLSPRVRVTSLESGSIPPIPVDAIAQFLSRPRVVTDVQMDDAPYIVSVGKEHLIAGPGMKVFARGLPDDPEERYSIYRRGDEYLDPDDEAISYGFEAVHVGDAILQKTGDPATLLVSRSNREVLDGDRLLPSEDEDEQLSYVPHAPDVRVLGRVIDVEGGLTQVGQHQLVVINLGARDGIEAGHVLAVFRDGGEVVDDFLPRYADLPEPTAHIERDPDLQGGADGLSIAADRLARAIGSTLSQSDRRANTIQLPDEHAGLVMIIRRFEDISYGLVMHAERAIHVADVVRNPD